jgi:predicted dehydrogenase
MALRVGLIGCGGIAKHHWNGFEKVLGRADLVALCDISADNRAWFKQHVPHAAEYDDFNKMIAAEKLDAVDICLPHALHHPCILAAIKAGAHWICEKPLCMTLDEAADIDRAMRDTKLIGMSAHNQAFFPALLEAKRLITENQLGEIYMILSEDCFIMGLPAPGALPGTKPWTAVAPGMWRADLKQMGGGELIDTGYHPSYRMLFLAGSEPVSVAAITHTYRNKNMQAEDTATVLVKFANGITGEVRTSWALQLPSGHYPFHVIAEHGEIYGSATELFWKPNRFAEPAKMTFKDVNTFEAEIVHFVECLEKGQQPLQSYKDGIQVLKLIRKSYEFVQANKAKI